MNAQQVIMGRYDDIINLPHHISRTRIPMPPANRAAQFAPFAALTGHDEAISETARLTSPRLELSEVEQAYLSKRLKCALDVQSYVTVTYFESDTRKDGGKLVTVGGIIKKIDECAGCIVFTDKRNIPLACIYSIDGNIFNDFED